MKLATVRMGETTSAVRVQGNSAIQLPVTDVGTLLLRDDWQEWSRSVDGPELPLDSLDFAPVVPRPSKIICVGLNYRSHVLEIGIDIPTHPTLFAKFSESLIGAFDPIVLPSESSAVDWEGELAIVIGKNGRRVGAREAKEMIAGYSVINDVSMRDWQRRTSEWLQGKTFEQSTPFGPYLVTRDDLQDDNRDIECEVDGVVMQTATTSDLIHGPEQLIQYISVFVTLKPGDVIATGTPGGAGFARTPPIFLQAGQTVVTRISGLGECRNVCVASFDASHVDVIEAVNGG